MAGSWPGLVLQLAIAEVWREQTAETSDTESWRRPQRRCGGRHDPWSHEQCKQELSRLGRDNATRHSLLLSPSREESLLRVLTPMCNLCVLTGGDVMHSSQWDSYPRWLLLHHCSAPLGSQRSIVMQTNFSSLSCRQSVTQHLIKGTFELSLKILLLPKSCKTL